MKVYGLVCLNCGKYAFYYDHLPTGNETISVNHVVKTKNYNPTSDSIMVCQNCESLIPHHNLRLEYLKETELKGD